ncbi:hypothetical protein UPYG_G00055630 [Umbra pygmaea]|uniref:Uncharacterized protein n=1 Tax=Umbra pygmaea TaxID=75934 RepID=A0ABD0XBM5_UMBPY
MNGRVVVPFWKPGNDQMIPSRYGSIALTSSIYFANQQYNQRIWSSIVSGLLAVSLLTALLLLKHRDMTGERETTLDKIEQSLFTLTEDNLRYLCERWGIDGAEVNGKHHRSLRRKIMEEIWENADSVKSEEQGMSWLLRLKDDIKKIQEESSVEQMTPNQSDIYDNIDDDETTECDGKCDVENKDWFPSNGLEEEPENQTPKQSGDEPSSPTSQSESPACPSHDIALMKRMCVRLEDCRKTQLLSETMTFGGKGEVGGFTAQKNSKDDKHQGDERGFYSNKAD